MTTIVEKCFEYRSLRDCHRRSYKTLPGDEFLFLIQTPRVIPQIKLPLPQKATDICCLTVRFVTRHAISVEFCSCIIDFARVALHLKRDGHVIFNLLKDKETFLEKLIL